ncbi:hypothetical protein ABKV19_014281 [Rosa sericea]
MGPRRAGDPPPYSSTPPRPPDPGNLRMKLQVELEETAAGFRETAAECRELHKSMASMPTEQAIFQSEILNELRQFRFERTAQLRPPPPPPAAMADPYHYQQHQPPPSSRPPILHQQQGVWYSSQNQYQYHSLQPPSLPQQWVLPPHADHLPPSLGYYHPPPPPHYAHHHYPQSLSHGPPQSYHPQQLTREWGAQSPPRLVQQKSGIGLAERGPEINSFCSPGSSPIMTTGSVQVQAMGCLSTMDEYEIKGIEVPIGVSLENGFDQLGRDVELQSEYDKVFVAVVNPEPVAQPSWLLKQTEQRKFTLHDGNGNAGNCYSSSLGSQENNSDGTKKIKALALNLQRSPKKSFRTKPFTKMKLKFLQLNYVELIGDYDHLSKHL